MDTELAAGAKEDAQTAVPELTVEPPVLVGVAESRHFTESTLWSEGVVQHGHRAVWGSWYDREAKRWGYACCHGLHRDEVCTAAPPESESAVPGKAVASSEEDLSESSEDSEMIRAKSSETAPIDWAKDAPQELKSREEVGSASAYVNHFVRFAIASWRQAQERGFSGLNDMERLKFQDSLGITEEALTPLLNRLRKGVKLERGESAENRSKCRETRTSMEGKFLRESNVLELLDRMATKAYERSYKDAHAAYMKLALGNKTWNSTVVCHVPACTMKGAREYRRNRDSLNTYDMDPVSQKYMHAMKKIVQFVQCIRPNTDDHSKNVVI
eukprot:TRINITY_DN75323_c0_g1_i1.p1 TRINITY_DN75323_c0_g1~~TRINITY_DN75323_c0_g1_i1.p1  ORF type:complete len:372 (-),score=54.97 TRINITY_DN75323_c0_g1_i1:93-1076(-)